MLPAEPTQQFELAHATQGPESKDTIVLTCWDLFSGVKGPNKCFWSTLGIC